MQPPPIVRRTPWLLSRRFLTWIVRKCSRWNCRQIPILAAKPGFLTNRFVLMMFASLCGAFKSVGFTKRRTDMAISPIQSSPKFVMNRALPAAKAELKPLPPFMTNTKRMKSPHFLPLFWIMTQILRTTTATTD